MFSQHSIVVIQTKNRGNKIVNILSASINDQECFKVPGLTAMIKTLRTGLPILLIYLRMNACRIYKMDAWQSKTFQFLLVFPNIHTLTGYFCCREVGSLDNLYRFLDSHFLNLDPDLLKKVDHSTDDAMDTDGPMDGR